MVQTRAKEAGDPYAVETRLRAPLRKAHQVSETDIKKAITDALEAAGYIVTRTAAGGYRGRTKGCKKGTPDIHVVIPGGRSCWMEVKASGKEKPTKAQVAFMDRARSQGAYACVVWNHSNAMRHVQQACARETRWMYSGDEGDQ